MAIQLINSTGVLDFKSFTFPAGEIGVKLNSKDYNWRDGKNHTIFARIQSSHDFMELVMVKDALYRLGISDVSLFLPYFPYSRQDRVCVPGEAFSLKVFAQLINSLNFKEVIVLDTHSNVTDAVIDRVKVFTQFDVINRWPDLINRLGSCVLVSPDAGANKKTAEIASFLNHSEFVRCDKLRDLSNGNIKETIVYRDDFGGKDVAIVDDIAEKAGTFILLAKELRKKNCGKIILFVTHGIFSGGYDHIYDGGIDEIWTTTSYRNDLDSRVIRLPVEKFLNYHYGFNL